MADLNQAGDALARLAITYKDIAIAAEAIAELGGLEARKNEVLAQTESLTKEAATLKGQVTKAKADLKAKVEEMAEKEKQINARCDNTVAATQASCDQMVVDAQANIKDMIAAASAESKKILAGAEDRLAKINSACTCKNDELHEMTERRDALNSEISALENKLAEAKAAAKALMES